MKYKYILFDADDTLLDFKADERNAVSALFREMGLEPTPLLIETYSDINLKLWKQFELGEIKKDDIKVRRFTNLLKTFNIEGDGIEYDKKYRKHLSESGIKVKNADFVCEELIKRGYKIYIVTNGIEEIQTNRFENAGLTQYFRDVFISEKLGYQKPRLEYFEKVFDAIGSTDKSEYLIVGDSVSSDILGGINSGIDTCWFNLRNAENTTNCSPTYTIKELTELLDILQDCP